VTESKSSLAELVPRIDDKKLVQRLVQRTIEKQPQKTHLNAQHYGVAFLKQPLNTEKCLQALIMSDEDSTGFGVPLPDCPGESRVVRELV